MTKNEYKKIAEINQNSKRIDTMYNDKCLKNYFHVYIKQKTIDFETENEIEGILEELRNKNIERNIWVFNKEKVFLYRLLFKNSKKGIIRTELQYPNQ